MIGKGDEAAVPAAVRIGYARVSTEDQNLALQIDALTAAGCHRIYCDDGVSGVAWRRPELDRALAELRPGDILVTWKLDRLGRSLADLVNIMIGLEKRGIGFRSLSEVIDTATPGGRLYFHVMAALAEFERALISERTKAGMASAKARGVRMGRPRKLTEAQVVSAGAMLKSGICEQAVAANFRVSLLTLARALER